MLEVINTKVHNIEIQNYIEEHLCKLLNGNNIINDLTTGIELYTNDDNNNISEYFKLLFYPTKNDFNFKDFNKIDIVYKGGTDLVEKKTIEFSKCLIELSELRVVNKKSHNKLDFTTTQSLSKSKYLKNNLVYNYKFVSKISSDFLAPSYELEEETFVDTKSSATKSIIVIPNYSNEVVIKNDIETTDTLLAKYIDNHDLENISYFNSTYLVGKTFNADNSKYMASIPNALILKSTTQASYQKIRENLSKKI